jgi:uncharacterized protein YdeI (YjbR/CyaY-like superfamily)
VAGETDSEGSDSNMEEWAMSEADLRQSASERSVAPKSWVVNMTMGLPSLRFCRLAPCGCKKLHAAINYTPGAVMKILFFPTPSQLRNWLGENHAGAAEAWIGFYKKQSGRPSITYSEAVDQALCFGWIDGVRNSVDPAAYRVRFTPRKPRSNWSAVNIARVQKLTKFGLMHLAGLKAFEGAQDQSRSYSYEQRYTAKLDPAAERQFRAQKRAWNFFQSQPPGYRRTASSWVVSAKREETRQNRLAKLIRTSGHQQRLDMLSRPARVPKQSGTQ